MSEPAYVMIDRDGCGQPAWLMNEQPLYSSKIKRRPMYHLNGDQIETGRIGFCEVCGRHLRAISNHVEQLTPETMRQVLAINREKRTGCSGAS